MPSELYKYRGMATTGENVSLSLKCIKCGNFSGGMHIGRESSVGYRENVALCRVCWEDEMVKRGKMKPRPRSWGRRVA